MGYYKSSEKDKENDSLFQVKPWHIAIFVAIMAAAGYQGGSNETKTSTTPATPTPVQVRPTPTTTPDTPTHRNDAHQSTPENGSFTFDPLSPQQIYTILVQTAAHIPIQAE